MSAPTSPVDLDLGSVDFALDEMPGRAMHDTLHAFRREVPV